MRAPMTITWRPFSNPLGWGLKRKLIVSMLLVGVVPLHERHQVRRHADL